MLILAACGCGRAPGAPAGDTALPTVEVTAKPDAAASLEQDGIGAPRADETGVAGVLPADFPRDVPLPAPSSLVDFGARSVTLAVVSSLAVARAGYARQLAAAGFQPSAAGVYTRGPRRLQVAFSERGGATWIQIDSN